MVVVQYIPTSLDPVVTIAVVAISVCLDPPRAALPWC